MELDRQRSNYDPMFNQLFVSRSFRLCKYVKEVVGAVSTKNNQSFVTFKELIHHIESVLPGGGSGGRSFSPSQYVDFFRFAQEFYNMKSQPSETLGALLVWKSKFKYNYGCCRRWLCSHVYLPHAIEYLQAIQTFLKGSIEAFQAPDHVLQKDYFISGTLGKNRCRLSSDHCEQVYNIFLDYQNYLNSGGLWDGCDRVVDLLTRIERTKRIDPQSYGKIRKSKVYVDEVQDYTQVECLLFFYIGGPGGLFLAGDPAQSVVEGTDFRFEDIRSVGHFVAGRDRRDLIPQKPKIVNVNFRSHSGVLNTAAAVLDLLFTHFPSSAKQLERDHGLFQGPRPGVCYNIGSEKLSKVIRDKLHGVVVLTHDDSAARWKRALDYPLVYGIREAKGLEFKSVFILDFFCELSPSLQKPWRDLILNRTNEDFQFQNPLVENVLKLLYTAITRSIEQLYFVETFNSIAGDAIDRWLTTRTLPGETSQQTQDALATKSTITNLDSMALTCDEWITAGINSAELAEEDEIELQNAISLLDRSVYCFEQAQAYDLSTKARIHRQSVQLRLELAVALASTDHTVMESKAGQIFDSLIAENLLKEAIRLIISILPFVSQYTRKQLEKQVLKR